MMTKDMNFQSIDDFDVQALADNELSPERRSQVIDSIHDNLDLQKRYQMLIEQRDLLKLWWAITK